MKIFTFILNNGQSLDVSIREDRGETWSYDEAQSVWRFVIPGNKDYQTVETIIVSSREVAALKIIDTQAVVSADAEAKTR